MAIDKLRKLKNTDNFLQIDFRKGYQYIDTAGEILNLYDESMQRYDMDPNRLIINKPAPNIEEMRVSVNDFWCHITRDSGLNAKSSAEVSAAYLHEATRVLKITGVQRLKRVGWRSYHLFEPTTGIDTLQKHSVASVTEITKKSTIGQNVEVLMRASLLKGKDDESKSAILFDIDISRTDEVDVKGLGSALQDLGSGILSRTITDMINAVLAGV